MNTVLDHFEHEWTPVILQPAPLGRELLFGRNGFRSFDVGEAAEDLTNWRGRKAAFVRSSKDGRFGLHARKANLDRSDIRAEDFSTIEGCSGRDGRVEALKIDEPAGLASCQCC